MADIVRETARSPWPRGKAAMGILGAWIAAHGALLLLRSSSPESLRGRDVLWGLLLGTVAGAGHLLLLRPLARGGARLLGGAAPSFPASLVVGAAGGMVLEPAAFHVILGGVLASSFAFLASGGLPLPLALPMLLLREPVAPPVLTPLLGAVLGGGIEAAAWAWRVRRQASAPGERDRSWGAVGDVAGRELGSAVATLPATLAWVALFGAAHVLVLILPDPLSRDGNDLDLLAAGCITSGIAAGLLHATARRRALARFSRADGGSELDAGPRIVLGIALAAAAEATASLVAMGVGIVSRGLDVLFYSGSSLRVDADWWWMFSSPNDTVSVLRHIGAVLLAGGAGEALAALIVKRDPGRAELPSRPF